MDTRRIAPLLLGVDIGGSKIAGGVVDGAGRVLERLRRPTPRTGGGDVVGQVLEMVADLRRRYRVQAVGIGAPGVIDRAAGRVLSATDILPGWAGTEVGTAISTATGLPVVVDNDVRAMALGEARRGAGVGRDRVLFASVGTGVGGAFVIGGVLQHGSHGTTGEIAHLLVPGSAAIACGCGRRDHLEAMVAGPAMVASYMRGVADVARDRESGLAGGERNDAIQAADSVGVRTEPVTLPEVVVRWRAGDSVARQVILRAADLLGRALAGLASAVDVDAVVIGGGVAQIGPSFVGPVRAAFAASVIAPLRDIPVLATTLGTDAPLVGAAELAAPTVVR